MKGAALLLFSSFFSLFVARIPSAASRALSTCVSVDKEWKIRPFTALLLSADPDAVHPWPSREGSSRGQRPQGLLTFEPRSLGCAWCTLCAALDWCFADTCGAGKLAASSSQQIPNPSQSLHRHKIHIVLVYCVKVSSLTSCFSSLVVPLTPDCWFPPYLTFLSVVYDIAVVCFGANLDSWTLEKI